MKITFNPFKLRQQLRHYATLCSKQCLALINANDHIAELIAENQQQQKQIHFLQSELKIAKEDLMIERVDPVILRKTLEFVEKIKVSGIGFVPIPYFNEADGKKLWFLAAQKIQEMEKLALETQPK